MPQEDFESLANALWHLFMGRLPWYDTLYTKGIRDTVEMRKQFYETEPNEPSPVAQAIKMLGWQARRYAVQPVHPQELVEARYVMGQLTGKVEGQHATRRRTSSIPKNKTPARRRQPARKAKLKNKSPARRKQPARKAKLKNKSPRKR